MDINRQSLDPFNEQAVSNIAQCVIARGGGIDYGPQHFGYAMVVAAEKAQLERRRIEAGVGDTLPSQDEVLGKVNQFFEGMGLESNGEQRKVSAEEEDGFSIDPGAIEDAQGTEAKKKRFARGELPGHAVCTNCNFLVKKEGHKERCGVKASVESKRVAAEKEVALRDAQIGDLLQKLQFLKLARELKYDDSAGSKVGDLFSNSEQRKYVCQLGDESFLKRYDLEEGSSDHSFGTAFEAEYFRCAEFRKKYMSGLYDQLYGVTVPLEILEEICAFN